MYVALKVSIKYANWPKVQRYKVADCTAKLPSCKDAKVQSCKGVKGAKLAAEKNKGTSKVTSSLLELLVAVNTPAYFWGGKKLQNLTTKKGNDTQKSVCVQFLYSDF